MIYGRQYPESPHSALEWPHQRVKEEEIVRGMNQSIFFETLPTHSSGCWYNLSILNFLGNLTEDDKFDWKWVVQEDSLILLVT